MRRDGLLQQPISRHCFRPPAPADGRDFALRPKFSGSPRHARRRHYLILSRDVRASPLRLAVVRVLDVKARCASIELDEYEWAVEANFVDGFRSLEQRAVVFVAGR